MLQKSTRITKEKGLIHPPFQVGDTAKHFSGKTVRITGGEYWGAHGFAGSWCWREVLPDGSLGKEEQGFSWHVK